MGVYMGIHVWTHKSSDEYPLSLGQMCEKMRRGGAGIGLTSNFLLCPPS